MVGSRCPRILTGEKVGALGENAMGVVVDDGVVGVVVWGLVVVMVGGGLRVVVVGACDRWATAVLKPLALSEPKLGHALCAFLAR